MNISRRLINIPVIRQDFVFLCIFNVISEPLFFSLYGMRYNTYCQILQEGGGNYA